VAKRQGIKALWAEIDAWFDEHDARRNIEARRPGATKARIARLEKQLSVKLPSDYVESLEVHDGGGSFESYEYLSTEEVHRWWRIWSSALEKGELEGREPAEEGRGLLKPGFWDRHWVPFAADSVGNLLCIDLDPGPRGKAGQLIHFESQDGIGPIAEPGKDFTGWLLGYRDRLRQGELVVDEEGFVDEPRVKPSVKPVEEAPEELPLKLSDRVEKLIRKGAREELVGLLEKHGLSANSHLIYERPLLGVAAEACNLEIVQLLVERGADINIGQRRGERTPLFWACWGMGEKLPLVRWLVEHGADVNALTAFDGTPLHSAVMWEHGDVIRYLLAHGADPGIKDASGHSAAALGRKNKKLAPLFR
jgi:cell wall assembly regulator SMI1